MNLKVIKQNKLIDKKITSLRKKISSNKIVSEQVRVENRINRQKDILSLKAFLLSVERKKLSSKGLIDILMLNNFKKPEHYSFAFKKLGFKEPLEFVRLFSYAGFKSPLKLANCLKVSGFKNPKDFSHISKSLNLTVKQQSKFLKKLGFIKIEDYVSGIYLKKSSIGVYVELFKKSGFKYPSVIASGFIKAGYITPKEIVNGLRLYGFSEKLTFLTALQNNGFKGREAIDTLKELKLY
jgi:hypothetical protein